VLSDRWFFITCRVLPQRRHLSDSEFATLAQVIVERRAEHGFLLIGYNGMAKKSRRGTQKARASALPLLALLIASPPSCFPQLSAVPYDQVEALFHEGKFPQAEHVLRAALAEHPRDARLLDWLGITLDQEHEYSEAERYYLTAVRFSPNTPAILNNLGNHYLAEGKPVPAWKTFLRVVALHPDSVNANLQLARISLASSHAPTALECMARLPAEVRKQPAVELLDAQALRQAGKSHEAEQLLEQLEEKAGGDPRIPYSVGMTFVRWQLYSQAVESFTRALAQSPTNVDVLSNLGVALIHTGDLNRAEEMFRAALRQRPEDADALYHLAAVYMKQGRPEKAVGPLVQAHHLAPNRPEILFLMGEAADRLGYYGDAAEAFREYLKIKPSDATARRKEAFAMARRGVNFEEGVLALQQYVREHPKDYRGIYDLAVAESPTQPERAVAHLNAALTINPNFTAARSERALINFQQGRTREARTDLTLILKEQPANAWALGALGDVYLQLGQTEEALAVLARAARLAPKNQEILMHYSQALLHAHKIQEAELIQQKLEQLRPEPLKPTTGLFSFAASSPEQERAEIIRTLRALLQGDPSDVTARVQLAKGLLAGGKTAEALETFDAIFTSARDAGTLSECGVMLLNYGQYTLARKFLKAAVSASPSQIPARLDLAVASYHSEGASAGIAELDRIPAGQRQASYYLLKAQMLDEEGKTEAAAQSLNQALREGSASAGLYFQAALFLIKHGRYQEAQGFSRKAVQRFPNSRRLLLVEAMTDSMAGRPADGLKVLGQLERRWPEWEQPYLIEGIILVDHSHLRQARPRLETAIRLGAHEPVAYYNLAEADMNPASPDLSGAAGAIQQALRLNSSDPYIQSLAARIAYQQKNYQAARKYAQLALRLWPDMLEAHQTLSAVYLAMGEREKSAEELKEVLRIKQKVRSAVQTPPSYPTSLLFSVSVPHS
jgi:tetratricopeptide (TPR) repeat protein